jgi:hypothetical protein
MKLDVQKYASTSCIEEIMMDYSPQMITVTYYMADWFVRHAIFHFTHELSRCL